MIPTPGTVYTSELDPALLLLVDHVSDPEPDGFFLVELVELADADDDGSEGMSIELTNDEWREMADNMCLRLSHHATA